MSHPTIGEMFAQFVNRMVPAEADPAFVDFLRVAFHAGAMVGLGLSECKEDAETAKEELARHGFSMRVRG